MDYRETIRRAVLDEANFLKLTLSGQVRGAAIPWQRVVIRPVVLKGQRHLQFSYFDARQDTTKNYRGEEAQAKLDDALALPFSSLYLQGTEGDVQVQLSKKGKAMLRRHAPTGSRSTDALAHDRVKEVPLPEEPNPFLQAIGIMDARGQVRAAMRGKHAQINEFLKLLDHTNELEHLPNRPLRILDAGCGSAYLTFALYHYLNKRRGIPATILGVDTRDDLIRKSLEQSAALGCSETLCFQRAAILEVEPETPPDIVLALHACDTATDDAIARGIRWGARLIVSVPCCHHALQEELPSDILRPITRHGILKQRLGDMVTDAFRALLLRVMGYRTDVIEFVSSDHTDRNLMIRAVKSSAPYDPAFLREYEEMKAFWHVTPHLETLLGEFSSQ